MSWLDFLVIAIIVVAAYMGMKRGLIGAAIGALGGFIGWLVAGQVSDDLGGLAGDSLPNDTWVTVISYAIIIILALVLSGFVTKIERPLLSVATLGLTSMVDRLGGLALGLILGLAISGALIVFMARLAYNFELPDEGIAGTVTEKIPNVEETREFVEDSLIDSTIAEAFIDLTDALPGDALGFVPSDFEAALDILEQRIEEEKEDSS